MKINWITYAFAILFAVACSSADEQASSVHLTLSINGMEAGTEVTMYHPTRQVSFDLNSPLAVWSYPDGAALDASIPLESASFYLLSAGDNYITVYLKPNSDLKIIIASDDLNAKPSFEGALAPENQLLQAMQLPNEDLFALMRRNPEEAKMGIDSLRQAQKAMIPDSIDPDFKKLAELQATSTWVLSASRYPMYHRSMTGQSVEINPFEGVDFLAELLAFGDLVLEEPSAQSALSMVLAEQSRDRINAMGENRPTEMHDYQRVKYDEVEQLPSDALKEYYRASVLSEWIDFYGLEGVYEALDHYTNNHPQSPYTEQVKEKLVKWEAIAKGQPAKDFHYVSPAGDSLSLADFQGKVVYLDVWATWCGPCLAEFPHSKTLKAEYEDNADVVFMYVSIDDAKDHDKWLKFLENDPEFKGVHLYADGAWRSKICEDYMVSGIPRYMLFDKEGRIHDSNAPRPSSGDKIRKELNALLAM
jgi:thiol-disulfide isomerase/thioredoxin